MEFCKISLKKLTSKPRHAGYHNTEFTKLFGSSKVNPCLPFTRKEFFESSVEYAEGMSISGVQQKLYVKEDEQHNLVATQTGGEYILKPSPEAFPNAAENEHAAMCVSSLLGFETAPCGLVSFNDGELAYITKRFDRDSNGGKIHQEDLLQCMNQPSSGKYDFTYEAAGHALLKVTDGKLTVALDYLRRIILAYAMGNDDLHLKNFSVQRKPGNTSVFYDTLTPNYDVLFARAFRDAFDQHRGVKFLALGVLKEEGADSEYFSDAYQYYGYYTGNDFIELGNRLGVNEKAITAFLKKLKTSERKIVDMIQASFMPEAMKTRAQKIVQERIHVLQITEGRPDENQ